MRVTDRRRLGKSGLEVPVIGFGGAPLGNMYQEFSDEQARATVRAAYDAGMRLFDTAPLYGFGLSEHRIGEALRWLDRDSYVLSTKVGRLLKPKDPKEVEGGLFEKILPFEGVYDYGYDGVMRSVEDSLQRLGLHRIDILLIHDVDVWTHGSEEARLERFREVMAGGYRAMLRLREEGVVRAIGAGINEVKACEDFARAGDFDCFLLAGRYTLLEQGALDTLLPYCAERDIALMIGGPYNTGILATGAVPGAYYNYAPAPAEILERVRRIEAVCARHGVRLASAALQFPLGHPNVATLIPGARSPEEIAQNRAIFEVAIPAEFWAELKREGLLREDAPTPV
ncbi:aldo/keto reductase [Benzoatithermus flavus]|uniref:Aldo/keto reductase n=1 Tax=Benzoatithermus flavus TaxID=3108223 RepID=A0ABU8XQU0_9PROT